MIKNREIIKKEFFNRDACKVAESLLGKIIRKKSGLVWLSARIIETEAYFIDEKGSHSSLGFTPKRKALFMPPGTIYMYYARGKDSLNISCKGKGNAVLIKSGIPHLNNVNSENMIKIMQKNNPASNENSPRSPLKLCSGQTLLCRSLGITVMEWDQQQFDSNNFFIENIGIQPKSIIKARRLGIPYGRDEHLFYRYIDFKNVRYCTKNPLTVRNYQLGEDYLIKKPSMVNKP